MKLLHVIPRFIGGGPERALLAQIAAWRATGLEAEHTIAILDAPVSAPLIVRARRLGARLLDRPDVAVLDEAIRAVDLVRVDYWNHPALLDTLRRPWPAARILLRMAIRGTTRPHVATRELGDFADALLASSPRTLATPAAEAVRRRGGPVAWAPALADMSRLAGYEARPHDGVRIGHVGLIDPAKLHPRFAELCAAVDRSSVHFDIYGPGRLDALRERFAAVGLAGRAAVHGSTEDLAGALAGVDLIAHPLAPDGYATSEKSVQEAMWVGLPVVVLADTGPADLIEHEVTGLIAADEHDFPRQLERLVDDATLRERLGRAARAHARAQFDPERNAARLQEFMTNLLAIPRREREPLAGAGQPTARKFVHSLGHLAGPFAVSLAGSARHSTADIAAAERDIAASSAVVSQGEGGVIHYRNADPGDPHLRLWSGLIAEAAGEGERAAAEFEAAAAAGVHGVGRAGFGRKPSGG